MFFNDSITADKILMESVPTSQKRLAKKINGCDENKWIEKCEEVMLNGLIAKFSQNDNALDVLTTTGHRYIYESSPRDKFWGTGISLSSPLCLDPNKHTGLNRLGKLLESVREKLCFKDG
jgi:hypothetical protein